MKHFNCLNVHYSKIQCFALKMSQEEKKGENITVNLCDIKIYSTGNCEVNFGN